MTKIKRPNRIPEIINKILDNPTAEKDSLSNIVEMMKPVFLISWLYLSVYWKEINNIKTSTNIRRVKNSLKNK